MPKQVEPEELDQLLEIVCNDFRNTDPLIQSVLDIIFTDLRSRAETNNLDVNEARQILRQARDAFGVAANGIGHKKPAGPHICWNRMVNQEVV